MPVFLALLLSPGLSAQEALLFEGCDTVQLYVETSGSFSTQSRWDVNLVNAPISSFQSKPVDLVIAEETLRSLNKYSTNVLKGVIGNAGFKRVSWKKKEYNNWRGYAEPLFVIGRDRFYRLDVMIAGDNGVGGRYGGLDVRMYFKSMHRSTDVVFGYSFGSLRLGSTEEETLLNLRNMYTELLKESYDDWKSSLEKDLKSPRRYLLLKLDVTELSSKQKKFIKTTLFPCLYSRADSLGYVDLNEFYYQVFYRLTDRDEGENEEAYITQYAELLQFSMGSSEKYPCSLLKSPMENYRATVKIDSVQKLITIGWQNPK